MDTWCAGRRLQMKTAVEYRAMAEECFQWARETHDRAVRAGYLGLAQVWLDAAARLDGLPAITDSTGGQSASRRPRERAAKRRDLKPTGGRARSTVLKLL